MIPFNFSMFAVQMWYVYLLIGLYLYMPIFSAWVRQASLKEQKVFLALWLVSLFIPYLREYLTKDLWGTCSWNEFGLLYYFAGFNGYLLLGHYIIKNNIDLSWTKLAVIGIPSFVVGYCITFFGFKSITAVPGQPVELVELFFTYCSPNVLLMTLPIFLAVKKLKFQSVAVRRFAVSISTCTFGIWMSHYLFLGPCYMLVESLPLHTMVKMIVCTILLLSVTWGFVYVVRKSGKLGKYNLSSSVCMVNLLLWIYYKSQNAALWHYMRIYGRMILTNFIGQSVICTFLFYPWGLHLGLVVGTSLSIVLAIMVLVVQIIFQSFLV